MRWIHNNASYMYWYDGTHYWRFELLLERIRWSIAPRITDLGYADSNIIDYGEPVACFDQWQYLKNDPIAFTAELIL